MNKVKLNEICQFLNGYAFKSKQYVDDGIRIIRIANVQKGKIIDDAPCFYPINTINEIEKYLLSENDLLISLTGNVGRVGLLTRDMLPAALNQRVSCIRILNKNVVFFKYLYYYLQQNAFERDCIKASNGVAQLNLSTKWLENYQIFLPSLEEQQLIVTKIEELLSKLDKGVEELNKIKEQLKIYRQAVLKEAFEGKWKYGDRKVVNIDFVDKNLTGELPELPKEWEYVYLSKLGELSRGKSKHRPRNDKKLFEDGKYPFVQTGDVKAANKYLTTYSTMYGDFGLAQSKLWKKGTLCITIAANIAETCILGIDACFPDSVVGFDPQDCIVDRDYVRYFIESSKIRLSAFAPATAQKNINLTTLENLIIPYCHIDEQKYIVTEIESRLSVCNKIEQTVNESLQKAESLRQSILKQAFEGKLV